MTPKTLKHDSPAMTEMFFIIWIASLCMSSTEIEWNHTRTLGTLTEQGLTLLLRNNIACKHSRVNSARCLNPF